MELASAVAKKLMGNESTDMDRPLPDTEPLTVVLETQGEPLINKVPKTDVPVWVSLAVRLPPPPKDVLFQFPDQPPVIFTAAPPPLLPPPPPQAARTSNVISVRTAGPGTARPISE